MRPPLRDRALLARTSAILAALCVVVSVGSGWARAVRAADQETSLEEALAGFDDAAVDDDALLEGFDDESDFDLGPEDGEADEGEDEAPRRSPFELTGSVSVGTSLSLIDHRASIGPRGIDTPQNPATSYSDLQRLRLRLDLQGDLDLPAAWRIRAQVFGYYDFAYLIQGRDEYTKEILDDYEVEAEVLDLYIEGSLLPSLDVKLGRQVVNWGRSDTLRVTDVLNPLNNREPGLADIEDLRLPVTMAKFDYYWQKLDFSLLIIPEIRYDYDPASGSDFTPDFRDGLVELNPVLAGVIPEIAEGLASELPSERAERWGEVPELAGAITGVFSGWDLSVYAAHLVLNRPRIVAEVRATPPRVYLDDDRVQMVGAGGNYTFGSFLFKAELAYFHGLEYFVIDSNLAGDAIERSRLDGMAGIEYYGISDWTVALEVVERHVFDYDDRLYNLPNYIEEESFDVALRVTGDLMNAQLHLTTLVLVQGEEAQRGATIRVSADYDLADGLSVGGGLLFFAPGSRFPWDQFDDNHRFFGKLKYSF